MCHSSVLQIVVRIGLETFLNHFSTLLVEAAAGYRNFVCEDGVNHQMSVETEDTDDIFQSGSAINAIFDEEMRNPAGMDAEDDGTGSNDVMLSVSSAQEEASSSGPEEEVFGDDLSLDNQPPDGLGVCASPGEPNVDRRFANLC